MGADVLGEDGQVLYMAEMYAKDAFYFQEASVHDTEILRIHSSPYILYVTLW